MFVVFVDFFLVATALHANAKPIWRAIVPGSKDQKGGMFLLFGRSEKRKTTQHEEEANKPMADTNKYNVS